MAASEKAWAARAASNRASSTRSSEAVTRSGISQTNEGVRGRRVGGRPSASVSVVVARCSAPWLTSRSMSTGSSDPWAISSPSRPRSGMDHTATPAHRVGCRDGAGDRRLRLVITEPSPTRGALRVEEDPARWGCCPAHGTGVQCLQDTAGPRLVSRAGHSRAQGRRVHPPDESAGHSAPSSVRTNGPRSDVI